MICRSSKTFLQYKRAYTVCAIGILSLFPLQVHAQQSCIPERTMIVKMPLKPTLGALNIWSVAFGEDDADESIGSGLSLPDGQAIVAGLMSTPPANVIEKIRAHKEEIEKAPRNPDTPIEVIELPPIINKAFIRHIDHRGRKVNEYFFEIPDLLEVVELLPHPEGYMLVANTGKRLEEDEQEEGEHAESDIPAIKDGAVWIGLIDNDGSLKNETYIKSDKGNHPVQAETMISRTGIDKKTGARVIQGYVLSATVMPSSLAVPSYASLYRLDLNAKIQKHTAFSFGAKNAILALQTVQENSSSFPVIAAGYMADDYGHKHGWIVHLDGDGNMDWQRSYKRGARSWFTSVTSADNGDFLVAGASSPSTGEDIEQKAAAGWLARLEPQTGDVIWQRYIAGTQNYEGAAIKTHDSGLMSVLFNASGMPDAPPEQDFTRLITFNPRGIIMENKIHAYGEGAHGYGILDGPREGRTIYGKAEAIHYRPETETVIETVDKIEATSTGVRVQQDAITLAETKVPPSRSIDSWVVVAPRVQTYEDPCPKPKK